MMYEDSPMGLSADNAPGHKINVSLHKTVMACIENGQFHREGDSLRLAYNIVLTEAGDGFTVDALGRRKVIYREHLPATCADIDAAFLKAKKPVRPKRPVLVPPIVAPEPEEPGVVAFLVLLLIIVFLLAGIYK